MPSGLVVGVSQEKIRLVDAYKAKELFLVAGDTHVYSCTSLDGHKLGDGKPGPVMRKVLELLKADAAADIQCDHEPVPGL